MSYTYIIKHIYSAILAILILSSSVNTVCEQYCPDCKIFTENSNQTYFSMDSIKNLTIAIELKGNPTTGYNWYLTGTSSTQPNSGLKAINLDSSNSSTYYADATPQNLAGSGGTYCFKFQPQDYSTTSLFFEYYRSWERQNSVNKKNFTFVLSNTSAVVFSVGNFSSLPNSTSDAKSRFINIFVMFFMIFVYLI